MEVVVERGVSYVWGVQEGSVDGLYAEDMDWMFEGMSVFGGAVGE